MERAPIILIADDNRAGQIALESMLLGKGYRIEFASDGNEAIKQAAELHPDLILLDIMMPGIDGYGVCKNLRANPDTAEVPIIMVTALDDNDSKLEGLSAGADDFISKPINRTELQTRVNTIVRLNRYRSLIEERKKLQTLSRKIIDVQENERRSIAIELHDEIGQGLTGLKIILEQIDTVESEHSQKIDEAQKLISHLINTVRNLSLNLRPSMLDNLGLYPALIWLIDQFIKNAELDIQYNFSEQDEERFPSLIETTIFRISQEALTNIIRHSNATQVWITIEQENQTLILRISDNGKGFDTNKLKHSSTKYSTGLSGMEERVSMAGGKFEISSELKLGTTISAEFYLEE